MAVVAAVTEEMKEQGLRLCRDFLGGGWTKIKLDEFHIERMQGGLSNMMYLCALPDHVKSDKEPRKVLLRMYGQIIQENPETVVTDSVVFGLLAEKKMGPKLYGVFTGGRVEEYVPSRHLHCEELHRPDISKACAQIMASFHRLQMPLVKEPKWLLDTITRYLDDALNNVSFDQEDPVKRKQLQRILSFGLASEFQSMMKLLKKVDSPVVFCHNDLQEGNILLSEDSPTNWHLIPIDFEYASYNYRGFDIANHFCEWCYDYEVTQPPYFTAKIENFPTRDQQLHFVRAYLADCCDSNYDDKDKMEQSILQEIAVFTLASDFLWGIWSVVQAQISSINFGYVEYAVARFEAYYKHKKEVENDYMLNGV